jgi:cystathionine beta-synthase
MQFVEHVADLIGNTPLVRLGPVAAGIEATVLAKLEYFNPGSSVKDRIALRMVEAAEASGELRPGGTIVEPTSGNTGVGLAMIAQRKGYKCVFICPDKVSEDKRNVLRAYGAEVVVCPTAVEPDHPDSYYSVSDRLAGEIDGGWKPNQYANVHNPESHYLQTGPELWAQTDGRITHFVAGIVGEDFWPTTYDKDICDRIVAVSDADSFAMTRRLAREEALLVGGSCGMATVAALRVAAELPADAVVVVLLPDGGRGYLGKVFNDAWMAGYGFLPPATGATVGDVLRRKDGAIPALVHAHPNETVADAAAYLREFHVSQMPVVRAEPPVMAAEVVGSVVERDLLDALFTGRAQLSDRLTKHMSPPLPTIGANEALDTAMSAFAEADAALVLVDGKPAGVVTRSDVLGFLGSA